jgi:hypothetical protein
VIPTLYKHQPLPVVQSSIPFPSSSEQAALQTVVGGEHSFSSLRSHSTQDPLASALSSQASVTSTQSATLQSTLLAKHAASIVQ